MVVADNDSLILETYGNLVHAIEHLNQWWMETSLSCIVYRLPVFNDSTVPDEFAVERLSGQEATNLAATAFGQFLLLQDQGAGSVWRVPGCIVVDTNDLSPVDTVNRLKDSLREQIAEATPNGGRERERFCRRLFRSCSMSQIYRHVVTITEKPVVALSFTWNRGAMSISRMTRDEVHSLLTERLGVESEHGNDKAATAIRIASTSVATMPSTTDFYRRKNVAPHPCANVVFKRGGKGKGERRLVKTNLPVILPESCRSVEVGTLVDYNVSARRSRRSDKIELFPVFEAMGLFASTA